MSAQSWGQSPSRLCDSGCRGLRAAGPGAKQSRCLEKLEKAGNGFSPVTPEGMESL